MFTKCPLRESIKQDRDVGEYSKKSDMIPFLRESIYENTIAGTAID